MYNKKPKSITGPDALIFYAQRLAMIKSDINGISRIWRNCENPKSVEITGNGDEALVSCIRQGLDEVCSSCESNKLVAKEKRRLRLSFNKTIEKMLSFTPSQPALCKKESATFVDIELNKLEGEQ